MKQLKFRIWDVKQKKFIFEYEASHLRLAITLAGKVYRGEDDNILPESDYVIQQYTGLNDINDIEIYEGDIVSSIDLNSGPSVGVVGFDTFGIYYVSPLEYGNEDAKWISMAQEYNTLIGNIHENPELLK